MINIVIIAGTTAKPKEEYKIIGLEINFSNIPLLESINIKVKCKIEEIIINKVNKVANIKKQ